MVAIIFMQPVIVAVTHFYQNMVHYWFWSIAPQISIIYEGLPIHNPLKPNDFWRCCAVTPLNCRMTYKDVANSVLKFGGILFTPIQ